MPSDPHARRRARVRAAARLAYVVVVLFATWSGLRAEPDLFMAGVRLWRALHPDPMPRDVLDAVRNVALFLGFGAVWIATGDPTRLRVGIVQATIWGTLLSVTVEAGQLFSPTRMASILDVATNGTGACLGAAIAAGTVAVAAERRARWGNAVVPHLLVAGPYLAACAGEAFSPLNRSDRVPGGWGGPVQRWHAALAEASAHAAVAPAWSGLAASDLLLFAPAGFLAARVLVERGHPRGVAAVLATLLGALAWGAMEVMRGMAGGDVRPWAVVWRTLATGVGAALAVALARRARDADRDRRAVERTTERTTERATERREVPLAARPGATLHRDQRAYALVVALWSLRPFVPERSLDAVLAKLFEPSAWIPLRAVAMLWSLHSVADVIIGFLLYVPVGAWCAVHRVRPDGAARGPWIGLALAAATEVAQLVVRGRSFDFTDVLVQAAGVLVGWAVVRRGDARRERLAPARAAGSVLVPRAA